MQYHLWSGYTILTLVIFRLVWGVFGSETARFGHFMRGPRAVWTYARAYFKPAYVATLGHNALGGWSVLAMLCLLLLQAGTGLFANDDIATEGPLYHLVSKDTSDLISNIHGLSFDVLLVLVGIHISAIVIYRVAHRENLLKPMLTGDKQVDEATPAPKQVCAFRAVPLLAGAAVLVWWIVHKL